MFIFFPCEGWFMFESVLIQATLSFNRIPVSHSLLRICKFECDYSSVSRAQKHMVVGLCVYVCISPKNFDKTANS